MITDLGPRSRVPDESDQVGLATASGEIVAAALRHGLDGTAVAEVWQGPAPGGLSCSHSCYFHTSCGAVILGDAAYEEQGLAWIGPGDHRLRILAGEPGSGLVVFEFTRHERADVLPPGRCWSRSVADRGSLRSRACAL